MRILVVGSGGREHALVWSLARSKEVEKVFALPGRAGFRDAADLVECADLSPDRIVEAAQAHQVDLAVIGPEVPLTEGVADRLAAEGIPVFGPVQEAARLEGSKEFAKIVLTSAGIPTARYQTLNHVADLDGAIQSIGLPAAIKADGLAAGKGVVIARSEEEAREAVERFLVRGELGVAGSTVLYEELLEGEELSLFAIVSGDRYALFPTARDYKRIGDGGRGPNTGGMGAVVPVPGFGTAVAEDLGENIFPPLLAELKRRGIDYRGILYAGLMLTREGPKVLEFNVRLGDPEAQALLPHLDEDLLPRLAAVARGEWIEGPIAVKEGASVCLVLASRGYPEGAERGIPIDGLNGLAEGGDQSNHHVVVFHAGTGRQEDQWTTAGGRVLNVVASGVDVEDARKKAYGAAESIRFAGSQIRSDIGVPGVRG